MFPTVDVATHDSMSRSFEPGALHQQSDRPVRDSCPVAEGELGMHAPGAVVAAGGDVDCCDPLSESGVAQRAGRGHSERHA